MNPLDQFLPDHPLTAEERRFLAFARGNGDIQRAFDQAGLLFTKTGIEVTSREAAERILGQLELALGRPDAGDLPLAMGAHHCAVRAMLAVLGERDPQTIWGLSYVAICLGNLGRAAEAEQLHRRALELQVEVLGERHPDILSILNNLAICLGDLGRAAEAEQLHRRALEIETETLGERHLDTISSLNNLANRLLDLGRAAEAERLHRRVLALRTEILGERHRHTIASLNNLANCLSVLGRAPEAEPLYRRVLERQIKVLGERHPDTLVGRHNLAGCLYDLRRAPEAEPLQRRTLETQTETLGERHPDTISSLNSLANLLASIGRDAEAEPHYRRALALKTEILGERHPQTIAGLDNLAHCLLTLGRDAEAEPLHWRALALMTDVLGERHPFTLTILENLTLSPTALCPRTSSAERQQLTALLRRGLTNSAAALTHNPDWFRRSALFAYGYSLCADATNGDWPALFDSLSQAMTETLETSVEQVMDESHAATAKFHGVYLDLCIRRGETARIPTILGRIHAPRLAALVWEKLSETPAGELSAVEREFLQVRRELTLLRLGDAKALDDGRRDEPDGGWPLDAEQAATTQRNLWQSRVAAIEAKVTRYRELRGQLGEEVQGLLNPGERGIAELRALLVGNEAMVLLVDIPTADESTVPVALLLRPEAEVLEIGPRLPELVRLAQLLDLDRQAIAGRGDSRWGSLDDVLSAQKAEAMRERIGSLIERMRAFRDIGESIRDPVHRADARLCAWADDLRALEEALKGASDIRDAGTLLELHKRAMTLADEQPRIGREEQAELMRRHLWEPLGATFDYSDIGDLYWLTHGRLHSLPYDIGWQETFGERRRFHYPGVLFVGAPSAGPSGDATAVPSALSANSGTGSLLHVYHAPLRDGQTSYRPIPFVLTDAAIAAHFLPAPRLDFDTLREGDPGDYLKEGCFAGHGGSGGELIIGPGKGFAWQAWFHQPTRLRHAYVASCLLGRMDEERGDPIGWVAALLLKDTQTVVAALRPVSDIYMPLLTLLFFQARFSAKGRTGHPEDALREAKRRMLTGEWFAAEEVEVGPGADATTEALLRRFYPIGMRETLKDLLETGAEPRILRNWPLNEEWRARIDRTPFERLRAELADPAQAQALIADTVEHMIACRAALPVGDLADSMVCFGRSRAA